MIKWKRHLAPTNFFQNLYFLEKMGNQNQFQFSNQSMPKMKSEIPAKQEGLNHAKVCGKLVSSYMLLKLWEVFLSFIFCCSANPFFRRCLFLLSWRSSIRNFSVYLVSRQLLCPIFTANLPLGNTHDSLCGKHIHYLSLPVIRTSISTKRVFSSLNSKAYKSLFVCFVYASKTANWVIYPSFCFLVNFLFF